MFLVKVVEALKTKEILMEFPNRDGQKLILSFHFFFFSKYNFWMFHQSRNRKETMLWKEIPLYLFLWMFENILWIISCFVLRIMLKLLKVLDVLILEYQIMTVVSIEMIYLNKYLSVGSDHTTSHQPTIPLFEFLFYPRHSRIPT